MSAATVSNNISDDQPKRVVIADDDEMGRQAVSRLLEREGYSCHQVQSGAEALQLVDTMDVGVVVADINMEGNTRLELLEGLRRKEQHISIILLTGHPSIETAAAATSFSATAYLLKPLDPEKLLATVRREFEQHTLYGILRDRRRKQEQALQSMHALETAYARSAGSAASNTLRSYLALAFEQTAESVSDLKGVVDMLTRKGNVSDRFSSARPLVLVNAIQETILILERTRHSFKSKELAVLRQKLETLLSVQSVGASAPPMPLGAVPSRPAERPPRPQEYPQSLSDG